MSIFISCSFILENVSLFTLAKTSRNLAFTCHKIRRIKTASKKLLEITVDEYLNLTFIMLL